MTPAIVYLRKSTSSFQILSYEHDPHMSNYGLEAADKLGVAAHEVFKTLVLDSEIGLLVAIIPANKKLNLKKCAKAAKVKRVVMAEKGKVQNVTGYVLGGVSPLGQKKKLPTFIDESASLVEIMYISAGKRGLEIQIKANDLKQHTQSSFVPLTE